MALPTQNAPGIAKVEVVYSDDAQRVQNTFHVDSGTGSSWTEAQLDDLLDCAYTAFWGAIKPLVPATMSLVQLIATDLTNLQSLKITRPVDPPEPGTNVSPALPNSVTKAIRLDTGSRGKGENGRTFVPALTEADVTVNIVSGAALAAWVAAIEAFRTAIPGAVSGAVLCVLSRYLGNVRRTDAIGRPVLHVNTANAYVDVQKDRLPYHKKHKKQTAPTP